MGSASELSVTSVISFGRSSRAAMQDFALARDSVVILADFALARAGNLEVLA